MTPLPHLLGWLSWQLHVSYNVWLCVFIVGLPYRRQLSVDRGPTCVACSTVAPTSPQASRWPLWRFHHHEALPTPQHPQRCLHQRARDLGSESRCPPRVQ